MTIQKSDRTILVTGGSRGLGLALVRTLLAEGYRVGTCSRSLTDVLRQLLAEPANQGRVHWRECEVGNEPSEDKYFHEFMGWSGKEGFYGLVNNAGIAKEGILATFPNVESARILNVNLIAALRMARRALQVLLTRPGAGRIVNISSIIALRGYTGLAAYSASKAGLDGLTRALAREVGRRGITVNSVAPGYLRTDMSATLSGEQLNQIIRRTPLLRLGAADDITPVVRFLLSEEARFITGHTLIVDGGISC